MLVILFMLACEKSPDQKALEENKGWREIKPPRPDLQCWTHWNVPGSEVCAPSLTSTRGASQ
jgi:hypothetical protein